MCGGRGAAERRPEQVEHVAADDVVRARAQQVQDEHAVGLQVVRDEALARLAVAQRAVVGHEQLQLAEHVLAPPARQAELHEPLGQAEQEHQLHPEQPQPQKDVRLRAHRKLFENMMKT